MNTITNHAVQINNLCKTHQIRSLFAFGSVVNNQLNKKSALDFILDYFSNDPIDYSDNYFELKAELEKIFNRKIDLLENRTIKYVFLKK